MIEWHNYLEPKDYRKTGTRLCGSALQWTTILSTYASPGTACDNLVHIILADIIGFPVDTHSSFRKEVCLMLWQRARL